MTETCILSKTNNDRCIANLSQIWRPGCTDLTIRNSPIVVASQIIVQIQVSKDPTTPERSETTSCEETGTACKFRTGVVRVINGRDLAADLIRIEGCAKPLWLPNTTDSRMHTNMGNRSRAHIGGEPVTDRSAYVSNSRVWALESQSATTYKTSRDACLTWWTFTPSSKTTSIPRPPIVATPKCECGPDVMSTGYRSPQDPLSGRLQAANNARQFALGKHRH